MASPVRAALGVAVVSSLACGTAPTAPMTTPLPPPTVAATLDLSGRWAGSGIDPQGAERIALTMTQNGAALAGSADLKPLDAADGSCASCHKFKSGTFSGSLVGNSVTLKIVFPAGGDGVPTPMCTITFDVSAGGASNDRLNASYTGDDSCEGPITGGTFAITRQ